jgi:hypothetical protein
VFHRGSRGWAVQSIGSASSREREEMICRAYVEIIAGADGDMIERR